MRCLFMLPCSIAAACILFLFCPAIEYIYVRLHGARGLGCSRVCERGLVVGCVYRDTTAVGVDAEGHARNRCMLTVLVWQWGVPLHGP